MTLGRRAYLRVGVLGAVGAVSPFSAGRVAADHQRTEPPSHVTLTFDRDALEARRPRLITRQLDVRPSKQYGWIASSPDHDTDAYCYWTWYVTQHGITGRDSHYLDREPIYVFVDEDDEIAEVVYSGYHWLAARDRTPAVDLDDRPLFRVVERWHHYVRTSDDSGELVDLDSLLDIFDDWLDNGWEEDLEPGAAQNPWILASVDGGASRSSWWRRSEMFGVSTTELWKRVQLVLGVRGAGQSDL